ncbi:fanconi-associated nuclease 1-like [Onthophagus taurus]|uniref:fanconi-associated nuclease 1-like n=1 Tax=Onthophagus taurus TaxID=166361 RepID=UPI0039BE3905
MAENDVEVISFKQSSIKSFFSPCKGPLTFQESKFKSTIKKPQRCRRSKRLKNKKPDKESDDDDPMKKVIVKEEMIEVNCCPLSPQIYFDDEPILNADTSPSKKVKIDLERDENSLLKLNNNRSKIKLNSSDSSSEIINIAVTKPCLNIKNDFKLTKTQLESSLNYSHKSYALNIEGLIYECEFGVDLDDFECKEVFKNALNNIWVIIKHSLRPSFEDLLFENEKNLILSFCSIKTLYQFICCKLFTHQIKWYNPESFIKSLKGRNKLNLISLEIHEMITDLEKYGFIQTNYENDDLSNLLTLLNREDLTKICQDLRLNVKNCVLRTREDKIFAILNHITKQPTLNPSKPMNEVVKMMICKKLGKMIKITADFHNTFYKIHLMYSFTHPQLEIPHGVYKFMHEIHQNKSLIPKFQTSEIKIFENAKEFDDFSRAFTYKEELVKEANKKCPNKLVMKEHCEEILTELKLILNQRNYKNTKPGFLNRFTSGHKYASALVFGITKLSGTFLERSKVWIEELLNQNQFRIRKKSFLYGQLATIYKKFYKDNQKACETLIRGLKDDSLSFSDECELIYRVTSFMKKRECNKFFDDDVLESLKRAPNVNLFSTITIQGKQKSNEPYFVHTTSSEDREYLRVEIFAIRHYVTNSEFTNGIHCEGTIINMLFFILFWDIIYKEDNAIPIFINPNQTVPLDLNHDEFYTRRKDLIDERIEKIKFGWSQDEFNEYVRNAWEEAEPCKGVVKVFDIDVTFRFIEVIGRNVIGEIMERFVESYDECRAGLPDLFLWNDLKCKFVEVKGPGDQLSTKQKLWISFLHEIGVDVEVCRVKRLGGN